MTRESTKIIKDWAKQFPEMFTEEKLMTLMKRIGPLLININVFCSKGAVINYKPQFAVHILYDKIRLHSTLLALIYGFNELPRLSWKIECLPKSWHNMSIIKQKEYLRKNEIYYSNVPLHYNEYVKAADKIKQNSWIKTEGAVTLDDIWQGTKNYLNYQSQNERQACITSYEATIPIYTAIWAGELEKAKEYLEYIEEWKKGALNLDETQWKKRISLNSDYALNCGISNIRDLWRMEDWKKKVSYYLNNPEELRQIVKDEVIAHKLEKVPYQNIAGAAYQK